MTPYRTPSGLAIAVMNPLFSYYLDAVRYCRKYGLDYSKIVRHDWRTWRVTA